MYDVIIVGSGIAGTYLASLLKDVNVLVLEKDKKPKLKDSGIVSTAFRQFIPARHVIKHKIKRMKVVSPSGKQFALSKGGTLAYIVDRRNVIRELRRGIKVRYENVENVVFGDNSVLVETDNNDYTAKLVIGADGANSVVRKAAGLNDLTLIHGFISTTKNNLGDDIRVFLNKYFSPDFFSWVVPQNREYGLMTAIRPLDYFSYFKRKMELPDGSVSVSPIPYGLAKSYSDRALLVGDAASQTKPVSGGGIVFALRACKHAKETIKYALEQNRFDQQILRSYELQWRSELASEIKRQMRMRRIYRKMTNKDIDKLFKKFGPHIERARDYDYDKLSSLSRAIPRWELFKFMLRNFFNLF